MPWTSSDATKHSKKADTEKKQKQWASIANSVLEKCLADGGNEKECSAKAITQASGVIAKLEDLEHSFYYLTDISEIELEEKDDKKSSWIEIFRIGKWNHPQHGIIEGTKKLFNDFIDNWKNKILGRDIAVDKTHKPEDGATGWVKDMKIVGDRLKALVEWTPFGLDLIENKGFKYFSPEYRDSYTDKETGKEYKNVLYGGALTNRPFLTDLAPIILSEDVEVFQKYEDKSDIDFKEELWKSLQEYANNDEEKIKNIMGVMQEHIQEMVKEMKTKDGEVLVKSIIKSHMKQMMNEIMNNMEWVKSVFPSNEVKSNH